MLSFSHSVVSDSAIPWSAACQTSMSFTVSQPWLKLTSVESVMPSNHLILCCLLLLLHSTLPSIRVCPMRWLFASGGQSSTITTILLVLLLQSSSITTSQSFGHYWSFGVSISPSNEHSGLVSFRMDCFDLFPYLCYACCVLSPFSCV